MKKTCVIGLCAVICICALAAGCGGTASQTAQTAAVETLSPPASDPPAETPQSETPPPPAPECPLEDGVYLAEFDTDSSMFHVSEALEGKGVLTVEGGVMSIHVVLASKNVLNLYPGTAEDAAANEANWLQPIAEEVTYSDGMTEEVFAFDIPVPALDAEFDCALIGKKGVWYDHKVSVSDPIPVENQADPSEMTVAVTLSGGSGRAGVSSPAALRRDENGVYWAVIVWSSPNYEYMLVDGVQYDPIQTEGNSTFEIPVELDRELPVSALTVAMSSPHLVEYTLYFDSASIT